MISIERKILASSAVVGFFVVGIASVHAQFSPPTCTPPNCSPAVIQNIPLTGSAQSAGINITGDAKLGATFQTGANAPVLSGAGQNLMYGNISNSSSAGSLLLLQMGGVDRFRVDVAGNMTIAGTITAPGGLGGDGSSITNINASNITSGTLSAARLPANVAYIDASQIFSGNNTFSSMTTYGSAGLNLSAAQNLLYGNIDTASTGSLLLLQKESIDQFRVTNAGNVTAAGVFTGNGSGLTTLNASNLSSGTVPSARVSGTYSNVLTLSGNNSYTGLSSFGSAALNVAAGQNLLYGNVDTASAGNLLLLQNESVDRFKVDAAGNVTAAGNMTIAGQAVCRADGTNCPPTVDGSGTLNTVVKFTPSGSAVGNSQITDDGTTVTVANSLTVNGNTTLGDAAGDTLTSRFGQWNFVNNVLANLGAATWVFQSTTDVLTPFNVVANSLTGGTAARINSSANRSGVGSLLRLDDTGAASNSNRILEITSANAGASAVAVNIDLDNGNVNNTAIALASDETTVSGTAADTEKFRVTAGGNVQMDGALQVDGNTALGNANADRTTVTGELVLGSQPTNPTGVNGMMFYNSLNNKFRCFENGAWIDCGTESDTFDSVTQRGAVAGRNVAIDNEGDGFTSLGVGALSIESTGTGLYAEGNSYGVQGSSATVGVWGGGGTYGGYFGTTTAAGYGVYAQAFDISHVAVYGSGQIQATGGAGFGGVAPSTIYGVYAQGSSAGGRFADTGGTSAAYVAYGSYGVYSNGSSAGVYAYNSSSSLIRGALGYNSYGVYGANTYASGTTNYGLYGYASNGSTNYGLYIGAGTARISCSSLFVDNGSNITCSDIAEVYHAGEQLEAGDVIVWKPSADNKVFKSRTPYDNAIAGIYSTSPGVLMGNQDEQGAYGVEIGNANTAATIKKMGATQAPVALAGRVPVKVTLEGGIIKPGDLLTSSTKPGYAMKASKTGRVVCMAMQSYDGTQAGDKILCYVNPHQWVNPDDYKNLKAELEEIKDDVEALKSAQK